MSDHVPECGSPAREGQGVGTQVDSDPAATTCSSSIGGSTHNSAGPLAVPDHELLRRIGGGSYGEVWLARNIMGAYRAVKIVSRSAFDNDRPFEREFRGIQKFEPISRSHPSQVAILHVGRSGDCFYYVMELADDGGANPKSEESEEPIQLSEHDRILPADSSEPAFGVRNSELYTPRTLKLELQRRRRLPFSECLEVGLALTTALDHLHKHGLVHRDVKPSNVIFVNGIPKLADIGLVTDMDATVSFVGTEGFIPPEGPGTPQADIYSLGKVLYEISTGKDRQDFPEPPTLLGEFPDRQQVLELGEIIKKACVRDVDDRYQSAEAMQADLLLLKTGGSVQRAHVLERRLKMTRRVTVGIAAVMVLAVVPYYLAIKQARRARAEAIKSQEVAQLLKDMLRGAEPEVARGRDTTLVRDMLDKALQRVNSLNGQPEVQAELWNTIGRTYHAIGRYTAGEAVQRRALATWKRILGNENLQVKNSLIYLGSDLFEAKKFIEMETVEREALDIMKRLPGIEERDRAECLCLLGFALSGQGKNDEAEALQRQALQIRLQLFGRKHKDVAFSLNALAGVLRNQHNLGEAEDMFRDALKMRQELLGKDAAAGTERNLALVLAEEGKLEEAEGLLREAVLLTGNWLGGEHPAAMNAVENLAQLLQLQGKSVDDQLVYRELIKRFLELANEGRADAQSALGTMYEKGYGVTRDIPQALEWYRKAAEQGDAHAQNALGSLCSQRGGDADLTEALGWYRKAAEQGEVLAQFNLGVAYENGEGTPKDPREASKWYRKALEQGFTPAQYSLGRLYYRGKGVKDLAEAFRHFRSAAEQGDRRAQNDLGSMYDDGEGGQTNLTEALRWFRKAAELPTQYDIWTPWSKNEAEQAIATAQYNLGRLYHNGRGVPKDFAEALKWYQLAAAKGEDRAQNNIGRMYLLGEGVETNFMEAVAWYRKAAEHSNEVAQCNLAGMYLQGQGVPKDPVEAVKWYRKAADQGQPKAQSLLGFMYYKGQGVSKDRHEAIKWIRQAADQGDPDAQNNLGELYRHGDGVDQDQTEALKWYRKAAEQGDARGQRTLADLFWRGDGTVRDVAEALKWYRKAAEQGDAQDLNALAWVLVTSDESQIRDASAAIQFAEKAVAMTNRKDPSIMDTLAAAYAEAGQYERAISIQNEALAIPQKSEQKEDLLTHLKLYKMGVPYREIDFDITRRRAESLQSQHKGKEAQSAIRAALEVQRRQLGDAHPQVVMLIDLLIDFLRKDGRDEDAQSVANDVLTPALKVPLHNPDLLWSRADLLARRGRWTQAAADLIEFIRLRPSGHRAYHQLSPLLVAGNDLANYRRYCGEAVERFRETKDPNIAERMAKDCLILPDSGADMQVVTAWADLAVSAVNPGDALAWFHLCKGLAEYRQGNSAQAADWAQKALADPDPLLDLQVYSLLTMADYQLGRTNEARIAFAKAAEIAESKLPGLESGDVGGEWNDWLIGHALLEEAKPFFQTQRQTAQAK